MGEYGYGYFSGVQYRYLVGYITLRITPAESNTLIWLNGACSPPVGKGKHKSTARRRKGPDSEYLVNSSNKASLDDTETSSVIDAIPVTLSWAFVCLVS